VLLIPVLNKKHSEEDVFKVFRANSNEVWETDFLISCFPVLEEYSKYFNLVKIKQKMGKLSASE